MNLGIGNFTYDDLYSHARLRDMALTFDRFVEEHDAALFARFDAYRQAVLINHGYQQDLGLLDLPKRLRPGQGGIAAGVILVLIGVYALLERFASIQLDWIFDLWPLFAVGLGVWLIWGTIRDRRDPTV